MTECKHRWEPVTYIKSLNPDRYWYECQRCHKFITTLLKEKQ